MKTLVSETLKQYFNFLLLIFKFQLKEIKSYDYALYAKFLSDSVGVYFIFEFRDSIPQILLSKLYNKELELRPGLYTLQEWYKDETFKLRSFYLDEIISFRKGKEYKSYFENVQTIEEAIKISTQLTEEYAKDFVSGNEESYAKMDTWFKAQVMNS